MKKLPLDVSNFPLMVQDNYLYVDKTELIHLMITDSRYYFLSRPRRFGKSLLVSTLKEIFTGNKELFKDLWIGKSSYTWPEHPVIHLDFSNIDIENTKTLKNDLSKMLDTIAEKAGINIANSTSPASKINALVTALSKKNKVVIIIDEYDYPIVNQLKNLPIAEKNRDVLKSLFATIKSLDEHLRAIFLTGVTKFTKTSVFSGLNNLLDISLDDRYASLLGYTHSELTHYFSDYIQAQALEQNVSFDAVVHDMCTWYDGYQFGESTREKVYNPFSVIRYLKLGKLKNYWFESATPSFLMHLIKQKNYFIQDLEGVLFNTLELATFDIDNLLLVPLLLQTGYLTIKDHNPITDNYTLGYPNEEVKNSFLTIFLQSTTAIPSTTITTLLPELKKALALNDINLFFTEFQQFLSTIPYDLHIPLEKYYQTIFYVVLKLLGTSVETEVKTNIGRIDAVIHTIKHIYIFEFKLDGTGKEALQQIKDRNYYTSFYHHKKPIILIGVSFDSKARNITPDWMIETVETK